MVDSDRGITNLHVPSDVIIDASMPAAIRASGQMWNSMGEQQDTKFVIPDHSYAALYAETLEDCKRHGAFDPTTMGTTPNVGLMAQAAEEYGSHDKTFEIGAPGAVRVVDAEAGETLLEHQVDAGDIWRMCQTKDAAVQNWIGLAVSRARATGAPAVFWLDESRPHDHELLKQGSAGARAARYGLRADRDPPGRRGDSVHARPGATRRGHDLCHRQRPARLPDRPVPDPRAGHQRQDAFDRAADGRWRHVRDRRRRLGAQARPAVHRGEPPPLGLIGRVPRARRPRSSCSPTRPTTRARGCSARRWTGRPDRLLEERRSPSRRTGELDNRGSHFYLALYWARELASQTEDAEMAARFAPLAEQLAADEQKIVAELTVVQGGVVELGGYYHPDPELAAAAMRPSATLNEALGVSTDPPVNPVAG